MIRDWFDPQAFIIVSVSRGGSTFLVSCLDSHPDIGCERAAVLRDECPWRTNYPNAGSEAILRQVLARPGYQAVGCKLSYRQFYDLRFPFVLEHKAKLIHNFRRNPVRTTYSSILNTQAVAGEIEYPMHTWAKREPFEIELDPEDFAERCLRYIGEIGRMTAYLDSLGVQYVTTTYEDMIGRGVYQASYMQDRVAQDLCYFLGVEPRRLSCSLQRLNWKPLSQVITNWADVKKALLIEPELASWVHEEGICAS